MISHCPGSSCGGVRTPVLSAGALRQISANVQAVVRREPTVVLASIPSA
jgi:hypothetical protein